MVSEVCGSNREEFGGILSKLDTNKGGFKERCSESSGRW